MLINLRRTKVLGIMSGTSLDGLDLALCEFEKKDGLWKFKIVKSKTVQFPEKEKKRLKMMEVASGNELWKNHIEFGKYIGAKAKSFLNITLPVDIS